MYCPQKWYVTHPTIKYVMVVKVCVTTTVFLKSFGLRISAKMPK